MKTFLKLFAVIAIIASFAGVSMAQTTVVDGTGNVVTIEQGLPAFKVSAFAIDVCDGRVIGYLPYLVGGGNTIYAANGVLLQNGYATRIVVQNQISAGAQANLDWWDANGQQFQVNLQPFASSDTLVPGFSIGYGLTPNGIVASTITIPGSNIKTGFIKFCVTPNSDGTPVISVFSTFFHVTNGVIDGQASVMSVIAKVRWTLYVRRFTSSEFAHQSETGISVANPNSQPATVVVILRGSTGNFFSSNSFIVPPMGQTSKFLREILTAWANGDGSIEITSNLPIGVVGLDNVGINFSAISAI